jgi:hypothetical protein
MRSIEQLGTSLRRLGAAFVVLTSVATPLAASARGGARGGGGGMRGGGANRPAQVQNARSSVPTASRANAGNRNVDNRNVNANVNRNNTNVNVNRDVNVHGGCCYGGYNSWGYPIATAAAVTATAVAVGAVVSSLPKDSDCKPVDVSGVVYQKCGDTYYQPAYQGGGVNYTVVNPPQ